MIRKSGNRFSLATNAERVCAEIMLKQEKIWCARPESNRHGLHRPLKTARLPVSPRARIELEDLVGLEPTMLSQRIKNPLPWPLGAQVHDWRIRVVSNHVRTG
jgi:hypothetical protein